MSPSGRYRRFCLEQQVVWLNLEELSQQPNLDTSLLVPALVHEAGG